MKVEKTHVLRERHEEPFYWPEEKRNQRNKEAETRRENRLKRKRLKRSKK